MRDVRELTLEELTELVVSLGESRFRGEQVYRWLHQHGVTSWDEMTNLSRASRDKLAAAATIGSLRVDEVQTSKDGTRKMRLLTHDGSPIESVLIPDGDKLTQCISSQVGCALDCDFCATAKLGFARHLSAGEIVDQVYRARALLAEVEPGRRITNIVYMGMGEPLLNWKPVARSLEILTSASQLAFGARRITVSTVGVPERIRELAREFPQVKLALSLHAPRNDLREEIIPLNRQFPLEEVLDAVRDHVRTTGKKATFEYIVLPGVNDSEADARDLARVLDGVPSRINLIGFNPFPGAEYEKPSVKRLLTFRRWLARSYRGDVTIRRSRGEDIQGACGQLSLLHAE
jgi:23S rRNA (adenine2503-C2)-methyltransferase